MKAAWEAILDFLETATIFLLISPLFRFAWFLIECDQIVLRRFAPWLLRLANWLTGRNQFFFAWLCVGTGASFFFLEGVFGGSVIAGVTFMLLASGLSFVYVVSAEHEHAAFGEATIDKRLDASLEAWRTMNLLLCHIGLFCQFAFMFWPQVGNGILMFLGFIFSTAGLYVAALNDPPWKQSMLIHLIKDFGKTARGLVAVPQPKPVSVR